MYRVLIVDDEEPVLDGYAFILKTAGGDFTLAGKARSGFEALQAIRELRPDVVFMDINIPEVDGIQVIAEVHAKYPGTFFILSTAYERFDLAQKAIPLGVFAYLVKPVSKKLFLETLDSVRTALQKRIPAESGESPEYAEKQFLNEAVWTVMREEDWERYRALFSFHSDKGIVLLVDFEEDPIKWSAEIAARLSYRHRCLHSRRADRGIFLIPEDADREELTAAVSGIIAKAVPEGVVHAFALGCVHRGPDLYLSCEEASEELRKKERDAGLRLRERLRIAQIRRKIGIFDIEEVRALFSAFWEDAYAVYDFPVAQAKMTALFVLLLDDYSGCYQGRTEEEPPFDPAEEIASLKDLSEWTAWGNRAFNRLHQLFEAQRSSQFPVPLVKAMAFIGEQSADRLQLSSVADAAQVSSAYLSRLFSEHLHTTFIDYLTELRIGNAERLIRESRLSMKEVAFAVGYQDPNYFGKIFRKTTGLSPTVYAAEHRADAVPPSEEGEL
jgi:two-component system response regulator YesN